MQFVSAGPDIPEHLLQAHEEGRVVFFCGAGISYPAGLPGFKGLVDDIYSRLGTSRTPIEEEAYRRSQFDATLDLLERRIPGQRIAVRTALAQALQPKLRRKGAMDTHAALLQLGTCREGALRLVTTNFDRVFERAAQRARFALHAYAAPMLPIPKNSRWNGMVYLHGLLPKEWNENALQRLVITSGDFGLAYLTERWAARFVSELFRNYVVCFVGYSINDPVLRYMMDALASDRMLGEVTPQAYALGDCEPGHEGDKNIEWEAKGVTPILYEVPLGTHNHSALHRTLKIWGETYRDGVLGKERVVVEYASTRPSASTRQDDFVGRMLWALSHASGLPAKRFAEFNPVPALEWLEAFSEDRYRHGDLNRFGVLPHPEVDEKLQFSLIRRPASYRRAPWMVLVSYGTTESQWDDVMFHLARWLLRHLDDPVLISWLAQHGGTFHDRWHWLIERELERLDRLQEKGDQHELDQIRAHAPNAIPSPLMRKLWHLFLAGRVKSPRGYRTLLSWKGRFKREGLTVTLRLELRDLLTPKVTLRKAFRWGVEEERSTELTQIKQLVDWELVLVADHVHSSLRDLIDERWRSALATLLPDFQSLLCDALDILKELGGADTRSDRLLWDLPSISSHSQNRNFHDWVILVELLRDAWLATREHAPERARQIALAWFELPYAAFKRLALFAAAQNDGIEPAQWAEWLISDGGWWLWSVETMRETMRLMVLQGAALRSADRDALEAAILAGPPAQMHRDDLEPEHRQRWVDHSIWLRLSKLQQGAAQLGDVALQWLEKASTDHPDWKLSPNEQDEFAHWMSGTGDPDFEELRDIQHAPRKRSELVAWLKLPSQTRHALFEDTWRDTCRTRFFHSFLALADLAQEGIWPTTRWGEALSVWSEEALAPRSWRYAAPLVQTLPNAEMTKIVREIGWWIEAASKSIDRHESVMLDLCRRILEMPLGLHTGVQENGKPSDSPVTEAINHPIGHATQALLNIWFKRTPADNDGLPADIEPLLTQLCEVDADKFRHGRVLLATYVIPLFRVDRLWTETYLLPLFDWNRSSVEAKAAWEGFLWSPRLYRPLLNAFKSSFLSTAHHYTKLGEHRGQFAIFLTYAALEPMDGYTPQDFQVAIGALPQEGLDEAARALSRAIESVGERREDYWKNRISSFWHQCWPKSRTLASSSIADSLARVCIAAGGEFPSALAAVVDWLHPIEHPDYVIHRLYESGLCARYPDNALRLLDTLLDDQLWPPGELEKCLTDIAEASPTLREDTRFKRLFDYYRGRAT